MNFKSFDELKSHAETMPVQKTYQVGAWHSNHSRAVYQIGLIQILIDTVFPYNFLKPSQEWYWTGHNMTDDEAQKYAKKYNATVEDAYYSDHDEKQIMFSKLDDLLQWVWDTKKDELNA